MFSYQTYISYIFIYGIILKIKYLLLVLHSQIIIVFSGQVDFTETETDTDKESGNGKRKRKIEQRQNTCIIELMQSIVEVQKLDLA